ncbi:MAG: Si-specific NAD(P)(+) transhydrogenase [Balneolaceae bacterium]|nr:Si-specific NAD(P)(+) transhydrogenase [Balneolaceae bacterium]
MKYDYDVIILGSGPAGFSCAMQSSKFDKKALIVEANEQDFGGNWINTGTVPSKALRETARIIQRFKKQFSELEHEKTYKRHQMADLHFYKQQIQESKIRKVETDFDKNEVDTIRGHGKLKSDHEVVITTHEGEEKTLSAEFILISTGSRPVQPKEFHIDHDKVLDWNSVLKLNHIPHQLVIIGGGVNAVEYATTFSNLGCRVSLLNPRDNFLPFLDHEIKEEFKSILKKEKVEVLTSVYDIDVQENSLRNTTEVKYKLNNDHEEGRTHVLETEHVLFLSGKIPNTDTIGLSKAGVETDEKNYIVVDDNYKTNVDNIYAAGDVIGYPALASASFSEGRLASCRMFGIDALDVPPEIPFAIYSIPEISNIGLTEEDANEMGLNVTVGRAYYRNITQGHISNQDDGMLKLVFSTETLKILGIHIIGERASDLIHLGQAVMSLGGDIRYFINHVLNYPTYSEAYRTAALNGINRVYKAGVKYKKILKHQNKED